MKNKSGVKDATLAFVLGSGNCQTTTDVQDNLADVKAFVAAGGHVKASFGGASGTYLENTCSNAAAMQATLEAFVDQTGITDLDFDVEQSQAETGAVNTLRAQALAAVQKSRGIQVAFTVPADLNGIGSSVNGTLKAAISAGVAISHINLMTMDYGGQSNMGAASLSSANGAHTQILSLIPGTTSAAAWSMIGITPMIGQNDTGEVFTLANAQTVATFAKANGVGLLSFWAIQRDQAGSGSYADFSLAESSDFQFSAIFDAVAN